MGDPVYQRDPHPAPDADFEPGALAHLSPGRSGRLLDPRRTPVTVTAVRPERGEFTVRLDGYEDAGAAWDTPLWEVAHFQFARGGPAAGSAAVAVMEAAVERFDRPLEVARDRDAEAATRARLAEETRRADAWLRETSRFVAHGARFPPPSERRGSDDLFADLALYMEQRGLWELDCAFAERWVSNPGAGELVKGHRLVLAELGLAPFAGRVVRDPDLFAGAWSKARRAEHVLARLGFLAALLDGWAGGRVTLYRGLSCDAPLRPRPRGGLVSASFDEAVARSHFEAADGAVARSWRRQPVPSRRVFMTYLETPHLNEPFREAEAVLLDDGESDGPLF